MSEILGRISVRKVQAAIMVATILSYFWHWRWEKFEYKHTIIQHQWNTRAALGRILGAHIYICAWQMSSKESAGEFAGIAAAHGFQTLSFDLPEYGERKGEARRCDVWNGVEDLQRVGEYVEGRWRRVNLYACSLGAFFSLYAYKGMKLENCLFQSPIVDMNHLIHEMFKWFDIDEERLRREQEIETPVDLMRWDYYMWVQAHSVEEWPISTAILYGGKDNMQTREVIDAFAGRFGARVTVAPESEHPFDRPEDGSICRAWLEQNID